VLSVDTKGKLPATVPALVGHTEPILDLTFSPFDNETLFTSSEDGTIKVWRLPSGEMKENLEAATTLAGHGKKVGIITAHPSANNVLASAGGDCHIGLWDVETEKPALLHRTVEDAVTSLNFNLDGSLLNVTTNKKQMHVLDSRTGAIVASATTHAGAKTQRSVWAKRAGLIITLGFTRQQYREGLVWDVRNLTKALHAEELDQQSAVLMPCFDEDTNMLYVGGKGDTTIMSYELTAEKPLMALNAFKSTDPQQGLAMMPKMTVDVRQCEVARFFKTTSKSIQQISFQLPRKMAEVEFQEEVYVPTFASTAALSAAEYFSGKNVPPKLTELRGLFDKTACRTYAAPAVSQAIPAAKSSPSATAVSESKSSPQPEKVEAEKPSVAPVKQEEEEPKPAAKVVEEPKKEEAAPKADEKPATENAVVEEKPTAKEAEEKPAPAVEAKEEVAPNSTSSGDKTGKAKAKPKADGPKVDAPKDGGADEPVDDAVAAVKKQEALIAYLQSQLVEAEEELKWLRAKVRPQASASLTKPAAAVADGAKGDGNKAKNPSVAKRA
jgi:coronin-1B/1C/6